jgi:hypothetical protein
MCRCQFIRAKKQSDRNWFTWNNIHMLVWDCFEKHKNKDMSQLKDQKVIKIYVNLKGGKKDYLKTRVGIYLKKVETLVKRLSTNSSHR